MEILVTRQKHGVPSSEPIFVFTKMVNYFSFIFLKIFS